MENIFIFNEYGFGKCMACKKLITLCSINIHIEDDEHLDNISKLRKNKIQNEVKTNLK
jgi:hypothetical protein